MIISVSDLLKTENLGEKTYRDETILFSQVSNHDELLAKRAKSETIIHSFDETVEGYGKRA